MFSYFRVQVKECPISHNIICHTSAQSKVQEVWREIHYIKRPGKRFQTWLWWRSMSERWSRPLYLMYWGLGWWESGLCCVSRILEGSSTERWCATFSITSSYVERLELHKENVNVNVTTAARKKYKNVDTGSNNPNTYSSIEKSSSFGFSSNLK
jgi:hypothetical protein